MWRTSFIPGTRVAVNSGWERATTSTRRMWRKDTRGLGCISCLYDSLMYIVRGLCIPRLIIMPASVMLQWVLWFVYYVFMLNCNKVYISCLQWMVYCIHLQYRKRYFSNVSTPPWWCHIVGLVANCGRCDLSSCRHKYRELTESFVAFTVFGVLSALGA